LGNDCDFADRQKRYEKKQADKERKKRSFHLNDTPQTMFLLKYTSEKDNNKEWAGKETTILDLAY
jgi:hypothetical protein